MYEDRILSKELREKIVTASEAAALVKSGMVVGTSGFTGVGYPKTVPFEIAKQNTAAGLTLVCGASVGDELDGEFARASLVARRYPFQSNKDLRNRINSGKTQYVDLHLGDVPKMVADGLLGRVDIAIADCCLINADGSFVPTLSVGATPAIVAAADRVILELNLNHPTSLSGFHDIPSGEPHIEVAGDRVGLAAIVCDVNKIAAIVINDRAERNPVFAEPDEASAKIAEFILELLQKELEAGRLKEPVTIQSGVGAVANAVLEGLKECDLGEMEMYTEVLQDGALSLVESGRIKFASSTALSLAKETETRFYDKFDFFKDRIVLRPQDVSNSGAIIRRLGIVAMNTAVEADIYGNVNSTHVMGTNIINGIGGSGDFARNGGLSIFMTPSVAKGGNISCIVPMVSHVDSTEHDVQIIVTEQGLADLRGLSPKERAAVIIENCAHPDYKGALQSYFETACELCKNSQTPHDMEKALSWHLRCRDTGTMKE